MARRLPWLLALALATTAGLAHQLRPSEHVAAAGPALDLELMIPARFGRWQVDPLFAPVTADPQQQATLAKIYDQTLARTYVDPQGRRIMLSIAYGSDQSDHFRIHRPEVCYKSQGFQILNDRPAQLATGHGALPVKRLLAIRGLRTEPITYWVTVGDEARPVGLPQKLAQLRYGLAGKIPDGMLVRVSSFAHDPESAYGLQDEFLRELLQAMPPEHRLRLAGRLGA